MTVRYLSVFYSADPLHRTPDCLCLPTRWCHVTGSDTPRCILVVERHQSFMGDTSKCQQHQRLSMRRVSGHRQYARQDSHSQFLLICSSAVFLFWFPLLFYFGVPEIWLFVVVLCPKNILCFIWVGIDLLSSTLMAIFRMVFTL